MFDRPFSILILDFAHLSKSTLVRDVSRDLGQHAVVGRVRLHVVQCPARQLGIVRQHCVCGGREWVGGGGARGFLGSMQRVGKTPYIYYIIYI